MKDWVEGAGRDFFVNERFTIQRNLVVGDRPLVFCLTMIYHDLLGNEHNLAKCALFPNLTHCLKMLARCQHRLGQGEGLASLSSSVMPVDFRDQDIYTQNHKEN